MVAGEEAPEGGQTADHTGKVHQDSSGGTNLAITGAVRDVNIGQSSEPQVASQAVVRQTLPADVAAFTGRDEELRRLTEAVTSAVIADGPGRAVSIHAINGTAGVGKSALAVHAARHEALAALEPSAVKRRSIYLVDLAMTHALELEIENACELAGKALELAGPMHYRVTVNRVDSLRRRLTPWQTDRVVKDLDERLRAVGAAAV